MATMLRRKYNKHTGAECVTQPVVNNKDINRKIIDAMFDSFEHGSLSIHEENSKMKYIHSTKEDKSDE